MKNNYRKGFTLVELIIVIAVIAILSAVLIPTFTSLVQKANLSSDEVAVRNMNEILATEFVTEKPESLRDVVDALERNGYNSSLDPLTKGYAFVWDKKQNKVLLVLDSQVDQYDEDLKNGDKYINQIIKNDDDLSKNLTQGYDVSLENNIDVKSMIKVSGDVTIDMNGKTLDGSYIDKARVLEIESNSTLTINAQGSEIICGEYGFLRITGESNVTVVINGGTFRSGTGNDYIGAFLRLAGNADNVTLVLNDVNFLGEDDKTWIMSNDGFNGKLNLEINGGTFEAGIGFQLYCNEESKISINNAKITARKKFAIQCELGNVKISNCIITAGNEMQESAPATAVAVSNNGIVTVENCTLIGCETPSLLHVYNSGGTIIAKNNKLEGTYDYIGQADFSSEKNAELSKITFSNSDKTEEIIVIENGSKKITK